MKAVAVTHIISAQRVADVLTSALEGGSNYWYRLVQVLPPASWEFRSGPECQGYYVCDVPLNPGGALLIVNEQSDDDGVLALDEQALQKGLTILADRYPQTFALILTEDDDAETGDMLLQCSLFGEVIYG